MTLADFFPIEYSGRCYLFSYNRAFPMSDQYGEHNQVTYKIRIFF